MQQQLPVLEPPAYKIKLTTRDKELLKKLDMEHQQKIQEQRKEEEKQQVKASPNPKSRQKVSYLLLLVVVKVSSTSLEAKFTRRYLMTSWANLLF